MQMSHFTQNPKKNQGCYTLTWLNFLHPYPTFYEKHFKPKFRFIASLVWIFEIKLLYIPLY